MPRRFGLVVWIIATSALAADDPFAAEYRRVEGAWAVTGMVMNGDEIPAAGFQDMRIVLKGKTVTAYSGKDEIAIGTYTIVSAKGKQIAFDLTMSGGEDKGKTFPALNEWTGADTIRTCLVQPGASRPTSAATEKGDRRAVFLIQRMKP